MLWPRNPSPRDPVPLLQGFASNGEMVTNLQKSAEAELAHVWRDTEVGYFILRISSPPPLGGKVLASPARVDLLCHIA